MAFGLHKMKGATLLVHLWLPNILSTFSAIFLTALRRKTIENLELKYNKRYFRSWLELLICFAAGPFGRKICGVTWWLQLGRGPRTPKRNQEAAPSSWHSTWKQTTLIHSRWKMIKFWKRACYGGHTLINLIPTPDSHRQIKIPAGVHFLRAQFKINWNRDGNPRRLARHH